MAYDVNPATNVVTTDVLSCARCGEDHERVEFEALYRPIGIMRSDPPITFTHWAMCPGVLQPILLHIVPASQQVGR